MLFRKIAHCKQMSTAERVIMNGVARLIVTVSYRRIFVGFLLFTISNSYLFTGLYKDLC